MKCESPIQIRQHILKLNCLLTALVIVVMPIAHVAAWTTEERAIIQSLEISRLPPPPERPANAVADIPAAADLGRKLFFDTRLSSNNQIACSTCHQPKNHFADAQALGRGIGEMVRNTPSIVAAAWSEWLYWDGRRDSLWSQALVPIEASKEMGGHRIALIRLIADNPMYHDLYRQVFTDDISSLIADPDLPAGDEPFETPKSREAWQRTPERLKQRVNTSFANLGKAIAAFERTVAPEPTRFDHFARELDDGIESPCCLTTAEKNGLALFIDEKKTQCLRCHNGPLFTNGGFHNIGTGNFDGERLDFGRTLGLQAVLLDEFNCLGPYSDAAPKDCSSLRFLDLNPHRSLEGAFKVPSLRGVAKTAPYFHDGSQPNLKSVIQHYRSPPDTFVQDHELTVPMSMTNSEVADLIAFLKSLSKTD